MDKEWRHTSCVLETVQFPGHHTGVRIADQVKGSLQRFNLSESLVSTVIHDEAANAVLAGKLLWDSNSWQSFVCAAHSLQNAIRKAFEKRSIETLLAKSRRLVSHFKRSALASNALGEKQKLLIM